MLHQCCPNDRLTIVFDQPSASCSVLAEELVELLRAEIVLDTKLRGQDSGIGQSISRFWEEPIFCQQKMVILLLFLITRPVDPDCTHHPIETTV